MTPLVSILVPSYNHGKFIAQTLSSLLNQTFRDFEIIIVDDGSTDDSVERILEFRDPRIHLRQLTSNVGACKAMNLGIKQCRGEYIAVCNSDDIWLTNKLEIQLSDIQRAPNLAAVFSDVEWINDVGEHQATPWNSIFAQPNRSRFKWLYDLITTGNCLCHPSVLIRKKVYDNVGLYNNFYRQLPDYDMWLRVLQRYNIFVSKEKLVRFRLHDNNTSKPSEEAAMRDQNEMRLILSNFFRSISSENFHGAFGYNNNRVQPEPLKSEIASFLLTANGFRKDFMNQLGQQMIMELDADQRERVGITALDFQKCTGSRGDFAHHGLQTPLTEDTTLPLITPHEVLARTHTKELLRIVKQRLSRKFGMRK
ncbi:glycosyltransferase involved in cell wall biosynthesis [Ochrobactrum sp. RH1CCR137]|nr:MULTISPECIES: glycosyltransferase [unclassified Ochrobactrum]MBA8845680.1 glycosyltransferase involved in cell wall biosynthesis [Ochrobactrum sp. RH1CCR137]MBA8857402.1 glycosyltransferase involved in cell wall biosynthesis [Ochrobactrum sp. RH1CCR134]